MQKPSDKTIRCGVIGYGGAFNMGKAHAGWMNAADGLEAVAVCDLDPARTKAAAADLPGIRTFNDVGKMLRDGEIDLVTVITPHNTHAPLALQCLEAGKHVITEKPMCITVAEATAMIEAARKAGVMLSTFHNRRWDGDYLAMLEVIQRGLLGEVFHVEANLSGYHHPGTWWRADKKISGGALYDWGAHFIFWVLGLIPQPVASVTGFFHKLVWKDVTNEDHTQAILRFANGAYADVQISSIARAPKPRWRVLGTKGGLLDEGEKRFTVYTEVSGYPARAEVEYQKTNWQAYYDNVAAHLLRNEPLEITPEKARRVIAIIETAERSAKSGQAEPVPYEG
jgi:scyllo-inositol 2-dehydrogenase (NADP+)